jgi:hypothetical protein
MAGMSSGPWRILPPAGILVGLNHCRLDNATLEALARVQHARALRMLHLSYNSIGPKGAAARARGPTGSALCRTVDAGGRQAPVSLAKSPCVNRQQGAHGNGLHCAGARTHTPMLKTHA